MDNLVYLFAAYAVFWVVTFAFVLSIAQRQKRLRREVEALRRALESRSREDVREGEEWDFTTERDQTNDPAPPSP
ncbi:MAG: CcmD family protein [Anaerolineae bacterium]